MSGWQLALVALALLCCCSFSLVGLWVIACELATRRHRRPGYIQVRPAASSLASRVGSYTTAQTAVAGVNGSSSTRLGAPWGDQAIPPTPPRQSRTTAPGSSGNAPDVTNPGDNTTDAAERLFNEFNQAVNTADAPTIAAFVERWTIPAEEWSKRAPEPGTWDATYPPWPHA